MNLADQLNALLNNRESMEQMVRVGQNNEKINYPIKRTQPETLCVQYQRGAAA